MPDLHLTISIIIISVNGLNVPLKGKDYQTQLYTAYKKGTLNRKTDITRLNVKIQTNTYHANIIRRKL